MFEICFFSGLGAALVIAILVYYFAAGVGELKKANKEWEISGLSEGFVPQGITFFEGAKIFLISGYMSGKKPSRVYVVDKVAGKTLKWVNFLTKSGEKFFGHSGGICTFGEYGYLSSEGKILRFKLKDVLDAQNGAEVKFDFEMKTENGADFCYAESGLLWVGEFYKMGKFETDPTHHIILSDGSGQSAVAFAFRLSENGVPQGVPEKALSLPSITQGMCFASGRIFLSTSFALQKSKLLEYENVFLKKASNYIVFKDKKVPLWTLENKFLRKFKVLPPMAEEIVFADGKIYILFESAAKKYKYFMRTRLKNVHSLKVD